MQHAEELFNPIFADIQQKIMRCLWIKWGMWKAEKTERCGRRRNQVTEGHDSIFTPMRLQLRKKKFRGKKRKHIQRRPWTLTFLPSRNLRAVPMLATQWILFSFLPCSHGWKEEKEQWTCTKQRETGGEMCDMNAAVKFYAEYGWKKNRFTSKRLRTKAGIIFSGIEMLK